MIEEFLKIVRIYWNAVLVFMSVVLCVINIAIFYPGYMSNDSLNQLSQALGMHQATDLAPVAVTVVWRFFIFATGYISSMLVFQLIVFWSALLLLSLYVYRVSKLRKFSLIPLSVGLLPFVVNISGVIWKDNQMAFALLFAVALSLYATLFKQKSKRVAMCGVALMFVIYACLVRYNAVIAIIPIMFLIIKQSQITEKIKWQLVAVGLVCIVIGSLFLIINATMHAKKANPVVTVMIDDISNIATNKDIQDLPISPTAREKLLYVQQCANSKDVLVNNFWVCGHADDWDRLLTTYSTEIKKAWLYTISRHVVKYVSYRTHTFLIFLFPAPEEKFIWQDGIVANQLDQTVKFKEAGDMLAIYVNNFGYKHFAYLYEPWLWLLASVIMLYRAKRTKAYGLVIGMLSLSNILYYLSYLPTGATIDYRYIYWPVLSSLFCAIIYSIFHCKNKRTNSGKSAL
jgi:hypothetical protein